LRHVKTLFFALLSLLCANAIAQSREEVVFSGQPEPVAVKIYPNPAIEYLHVTFEQPVAKEAKLTVHNIIGNVLEVETETIDDHEVRVKVKDLPVGYYIIAIRDERTNSRSNLKFLKR
jgi:hypothetical protein